MLDTYQLRKTQTFARRVSELGRRLGRTELQYTPTCTSHMTSHGRKWWPERQIRDKADIMVTTELKKQCSR